MENLKSALDVALILRDFMKNEARTKSLSKGKLYNQEESSSEPLREVG